MKQTPSFLAIVIALAGISSGPGQNPVLASETSPVPVSAGQGARTARSDAALIQGTWMADTALRRVVPDLVRRLNCSGKNVVLYGPEPADSLLWLKTVIDQLDTVRAQMKRLADAPAPAFAGTGPETAVPATPAILAGAVRQSLSDLGTMLAAGVKNRADAASDEGGLLPIVAEAAVASGCVVYWPDRAAPSLAARSSGVTLLLKETAEVADSADAAGKPPGLSQRLRAMQAEVDRSAAMIRALDDKIAQGEQRAADARAKTDQAEEQVDWLSKHVEAGRSEDAQAKLNEAFSKNWEELQAAVVRQMAQATPRTQEDRQRLAELSGRVDQLRTHTEWLSRYTRDQVDVALQQRLKARLSQVYDELAARAKSRDAIAAEVATAVAAARKEKKAWETHAAGVEASRGVLSSVLDGYAAARQILLGSVSGTSPLQELLRAENLKAWTFDEDSRDRPGASIVRLTLHAAATSSATAGNPSRGASADRFVLTFVQYDPSGRVRNSGRWELK